MSGGDLDFAAVGNAHAYLTDAAQAGFEDLGIHASPVVVEEDEWDAGYEGAGDAFVEASDTALAIGNDVWDFAVEGADKFKAIGFTALGLVGFGHIDWEISIPEEFACAQSWADEES